MNAPLLPTLALLLPSAVTAQTALAGEDVSLALEAVRADTGVPGLAALAFQDGEVALWGAAGVRVAGTDAALSIHDPLHLGSCAKAMTASLAARLIEQGVLDWDTTLAAALPELAKAADAGYHDVTLEELLQHRGGIAERARPEIQALHGKLGELEGEPADVRLRILAHVLASPPRPLPASGFDYSNFGYMTAGAMLGARTGRPWEELIVAELFRPMGLASGGVGSPAGDGVPVGHRRTDDGGWEPLPPGPGGALADALGPAGLVHMALPDWAAFVADHLAGERGEDGFLTAETYQRLHRAPDRSGYAAGWGLGNHTWSWGEGRVLTHNGSDSTWLSVVFAMPEWDLVVVTATNAADTPGQLATDRAKTLLLELLGFED